MAVNGPATDDAPGAATADEGADKTAPAGAPRTFARSGGRRRNRRPIVYAAVGVTVAAVGVGGFLIGTGGKSSKSSGVPSGFTSFHDGSTGLDVAYPAAWTDVKSPDSTVRLIESIGGPIGLDSLQVRVQQTQAAIGASGNSIVDLKAVTDAIVSGSPVVVLSGYPRSITLNGLPGYYYVYTLTDASSGEPLVHAHYFLFQGHNMISLVFQSRSSEFAKLAPTFDRVAASLHINP